MTDADGVWSDVSAEWSRLWGRFAAPAQRALIDAAGITHGTRVLDVGCGSGEFLRLLQSAGAAPTGVDPSAGMRRLARAGGFDVRDGDAEDLPFPDGSFDVVTAVNALHFADDELEALRECARVLMPGGRIAVANWAESVRNDIAVIEDAVARAWDEEPDPDGALRSEGGLEEALRSAGLEPAASGIVEAVWTAADDDALVRGILLGEDEATRDELRPVVMAAARPFRVGERYVLNNALRWAVAHE